ncbi:TPA: DNA-binding protein [Yersinia enterocolitica]|nr:DNA-binding protein [Yersinia enterocolitica]HEI6832768.1 DNA-binding protein [Yersinia enterocolitica]HEN3236198.1 DNA-binding protein [Yersinia enterocolitica]HEN3331745.1 DNA-binding protein [Yersinia enterocolitica]HEN3409907.1 DNA-binding protein [Yersinia enterocolitica]
MSVLSRTIKLCRKTEAWLVKLQTQDHVQSADLNQVQEEPISLYDTLTPKTINDESMKEYFIALKYALSQNDVKNIAITGSYGAGKSTVVSSFMKYHCEDKHINVSLAGFDMTENEKTVSPTHQEVELSILQQILYKENRDELPDSRIDRIISKSSEHIKKTYKSLLKIVMPVTAFTFILYFKSISEFLNLPTVWINFANEHFIIKGILLFFLALISLYFITDSASRIGIFDKKLKLSKIAFLSGDVEASEQDTPSLLNNCLDEIVYFFTKLKYKIVIFEDLDRLGTPEIFVKLREINKIVNNNITDGKPVRFIYAVRDDLFLGADTRTKFFDFILPVIPYMDSRNAFTLLKSRMSFDTKNDKYLKDISAYISDMRSLQNLVNEYHVFSNVVDNTENNIKLLSLVFYKNIYALDYFFTDKKTGVLYSFIRDYRIRILHRSHFDALETKLTELQADLDKLNNDSAFDHKSIRNDIVCRYISEMLWDTVYFAASNIYGGFNNFNNSDMVDNEDYFIEFLSSKETVYIGYTYYNSNAFVIFDSTLRNKLNDEYIERKNRMSKDKNTTYRKLHNEISETKELIKVRNALTLKELTMIIGREKFGVIAQGYLDEMQKHDFVSKQQLLALRCDMRNGGLDALYLLLSDGLLMQDFMTYRSIFHKGAMSANDNDFLKAVGQDLSCETSNSEYFIDDEVKVINELVEHNRIYADGALHHQLMTHLIDTTDELMTGIAASLFRQSDEHIISVFSVLYTRFSKPETFDKFIISTLQTAGYLDRMIDLLGDYQSKEFTSDISVSVITCISPDYSLDIEQYRNFIHSLGSRIISQLTEDNMEKFMCHLQESGTCYDELFQPVTPTELYCVRFIAKNSLYQITRNNVGIAISCLLEKEILMPKDAERKPWTFAYKHNLTAISDYFIENIDVFVRDVFISSSEDAGCVRYILTHTPLSDSSKGDIVRKMTFSLPELSGISTEITFNEGNETLSFHDLFYHYDRVTPGWGALMDYICEDCNTDILTAYITKHADEFSKSSPEFYDGKRYEMLYLKIICNNDLDEWTYQNLVSTIQINMHEIDGQLSERNFCKLITMQKLTLDAEIYESIAVLYKKLDEDISDAFVYWFSQHKNEFMAQSDLYLRKTKDKYFFDFMLSKVLNYPLFTVKERADLVSLYIDYHIDRDMTDINVPSDVLLHVFNASNNEAFKTKIFARLILNGYHNRNELADLCNQLAEDELKNVFINRTQATISVTEKDHVLLILGYLQAAHIIRSFQERDDGKISVIIKPSSDDEK